MTVRFQQPQNSGIYFITFTCHDWLPLIDLTNSYDLVYKWFDYLKSKGNYIVGYVIMPNHLHTVIGFCDAAQSINTRVGNGKRFLAYGIVDRLKAHNQLDILQRLQTAVNNTDKQRGKLHQVFKASFDCKPCVTDAILETKLGYMHGNPCAGKWKLADAPIDYLHSSAKYYLTGEQGLYPVTGYLEMKEVNLNGKLENENKL